MYTLHSIVYTAELVCCTIFGIMQQYTFKENVTYITPFNIRTFIELLLFIMSNYESQEYDTTYF